MSAQQVEADLAKYLTEKIALAIFDAWELLPDDEARARAAVTASAVAVSMAAAALHEARLKRPGIVPSVRDFYFSVLKLVSDIVPADIEDVRRG